MGTFTKRYLKKRGPAKAWNDPSVLAIHCVEGKEPGNTHTSPIGVVSKKVDGKIVQVGKPKNVKKTVTKQVVEGREVKVVRVKYDASVVNTKAIGKVTPHKEAVPEAWNYTQVDKVASMGLCGTDPFGK